MLPCALLPPRQRHADRRCKDVTDGRNGVQAQIELRRSGEGIVDLCQVLGQHRIGDVRDLHLAQVLQDVVFQLDAFLFGVDRLNLHLVFLAARQVQDTHHDQRNHVNDAADHPRRRSENRLVRHLFRFFLLVAFGANQGQAEGRPNRSSRHGDGMGGHRNRGR